MAFINILIAAWEGLIVGHLEKRGGWLLQAISLEAQRNNFPFQLVTICTILTIQAGVIISLFAFDGSFPEKFN